MSFGQTLAKRRFSPIARIACWSRVSRGDFLGVELAGKFQA